MNFQIVFVEDALIFCLVIFSVAIFLLTGIGLWLQQPRPPLPLYPETAMWQSSTTTTTHYAPASTGDTSMATTTLPKHALDLVFTDPDTRKKTTIRDYFKMILVTLYEKGERFSGKRPFGNSGWETYLALPLVENGFIAGEIDRDEETGEVYDVDYNQLEYEEYINLMIEAL